MVGVNRMDSVPWHVEKWDARKAMQDVINPGANIIENVITIVLNALGFVLALFTAVIMRKWQKTLKKA